MTEALADQDGEPVATGAHAAPVDPFDLDAALRASLRRGTSRIDTHLI